MNFGKKAVALAVRQIKAGAEINDSYGAVYHHMDKPERQQFLQVSQEPSKAKAYTANPFPVMTTGISLCSIL